MTSVTTERLTEIAVHQALSHLLEEYQSEKEESQQDNDPHFTDYWESACQTICMIFRLWQGGEYLTS